MFANKWTRNEKLALAGIAITLIACVATILVVPEVRRFIGFDPAGASPNARNSNEPNAGNTAGNVNSNQHVNTNSISSPPTTNQNSGEHERPKSNPPKEPVRDWDAIEKEAEEKARQIARDRNAQFIVPGKSATGSVAEGSYKEFVFVGFTNTPVLFTMQPTKGSFWAGVQIYNSNNLSVLKSEFVRPVEKIPFTPQSDDQYTLRITGERNFGDYVIVMSYISGPPSDRNRPSSISMNGNRLGNIAQDSVDEYKFQGYANEAILFTLQPTNGDFWAGVEIFNSNKIQVLKSEFVRPIEKIPFTPQSDDEYIFRITGERNYGSYVIVLSKQ